VTTQIVTRTDVSDGYAGLLDSVRGLLDDLAGARLDDPTAAALGGQVEALRSLLAGCGVDEAQQDFGRRPELPHRGQTLVPPYAVEHSHDGRWSGTVRFGRYHLGRSGAVHGGSLALFFEDVIGQLAISDGRIFGRAAYTHVDFRALTPVDTDLTFHAWFVSEEGRKRFLRAEVRDGDTLCAEADGLVIELRPDQR
jgi:acyl-coenzyme A thioesterase PaaI-like protein